MTPQFQQVAQTYFTRRSLWVVAAFAVFAWAMSLVVTSLMTQDPLAVLPTVGIAAAVTGYALGIHAKSQFANPRARLIPGFARPHIAMLGAILVVSCIVHPLALSLAAGWSPLGPLAFSIALTAAGTLAMHRPHAITITAAFAVFLSAGTPRTINSWASPAPTTAATEVQLVILAVAWGSIAYWFHRLSILGEEDADYLNPIQPQKGATASAICKLANSPSGWTLNPDSWQNWLGSAMRTAEKPVRATTTAARMRLLREGPIAATLTTRAISVAARFLSILAIAALIGLSFRVGFGLEMRDNTPMVGVIILMDAAAGGSLLAARRARMGEELMLPLRRQDYFRGLFAASVQHALAIWLTTQAALIAYIALFLPDHFFPAFLAAVTALSLGLRTCMFGANISVGRFKAGNARLLAPIFVLSLASTVLIVGIVFLPKPVLTDVERGQLEQRVHEKYIEDYGKVDAGLKPETKQQLREHIQNQLNPRFDLTPASPLIPWTCAAVLMAAGVASFLDARKRWLNLELG